jgi:molecular chaperone DnaK
MMLKSLAEKAKIQLSSRRSHLVELGNFASVAGELIDLEVEITREEYEQTVSPLLDKARMCVRQALAAKKLKPGAIDRILLVGGTTYMPCIRQLVGELFGREPKAEVNPDLAVVMGAAVQAALALGVIKPEQGLILTDVAPFGLGVPLLSADETHLRYEPLIQPNTTIPYSVKRNFSLVQANQTQLVLRLLQDHKGTARLPEDAIETGIQGTISNIPPSSTGKPHDLEVDFSYDIDGLAKLRASIPATGQAVELTFDKSAKRMDAEEAVASREDLDALWARSPQARQFTGLINKAEKLLPSLKPLEQSQLSTAIAAVKSALSSGDKAAIDKAGDRLTDIMFDLDMSR